MIFRIPNPSDHFRLGITFKIKCSSVERNLLKRQIRESFRNLGPVLGGFDYNFVIRDFRRPIRVFAKNLALNLIERLPSAPFEETKPKRKLA